jgi:hypothetical protein
MTAQATSEIAHFIPWHPEMVPHLGTPALRLSKLWELTHYRDKRGAANRGSLQQKKGLLKWALPSCHQTQGKGCKISDELIAALARKREIWKVIQLVRHHHNYSQLKNAPHSSLKNLSINCCFEIVQTAVRIVLQQGEEL